MKRKKSELERSNLRYNMLSAGIYVVGIILLVQLFNLQIVRGATYREESNTRLSRESTIQAARGGIKDRTGTVLASSEMGFSLELFKTKVDDDTLNSALLTIVTILEENGDKYVNTFPISINPFTYNFETDEELNAWKTKYKIPEAASAEEAFYIFKDKYKFTKNIHIIQTGIETSKFYKENFSSKDINNLKKKYGIKKKDKNSKKKEKDAE